MFECLVQKAVSQMCNLPPSGGRPLQFKGMQQLFVTARKRSCGKVMFSQVCVILFTGGGVHGWRGHVWLGVMHG